jgi:predicted protein tyrosine phosphatase
MKNILFICSQNRLRSPTAEQVFASWPGIEVSSAGTNRGADNPLTADLVAWADIIFVMERVHKTKLQQNFRAALKNKSVICLGIPDDFEFMDPELIAILQRKVPRFLPDADRLPVVPSTTD